MPINITPALGWQNCAKLTNAHAELVVTLDVGPRILSYKTAGGKNSLSTFEDQLGGAGESEFTIRGGHRLWVSPEDQRSYEPDNSPVEFAQIGPDTLRVSKAAAAPWKIQKVMTISLAENSSKVTIDHELRNQGTEPVTVAAWALTVMAPGGVEILPQPPLGEHGKGAPGREFLPDRVIVPWGFTDLSDDRWTLGKRFFLLQPKLGRPATKLGLLVQNNLPDIPGNVPWAGYLMADALFIKTFEYLPGATYPDLGCNFETFTKEDFIELESLSPLKTLAPGQAVGHRETWHLFDGITRPDSLEQSALAQWLSPFLAQIA